jgi:hypothetical protein
MPLLLRSGQEPAKVEAVLRDAREDLLELSSRRTSVDQVSEPIPLGGQWLLVTFLYSATGSERAGIPDVLARRLEAAGVADAWIGAPADVRESYEDLATFSPMVRAVISRPGPVPDHGSHARPEREQVDLALHWLRGQQEPGMEVLAAIAGMELPVDWEIAGRVVLGVTRELYSMSVLVTDFSIAASGVVLGEFGGNGLALWTAGSDWPAVTWTPEYTAQRMLGLRELIRSADSVGWGGVDVRDEASYLTGIPDSTVTDEDMLPPMWYQVLSADRVYRLGGRPPGGIGIGDGRVELTIGQPEQWVPGHPDSTVIRAHARDLLSVLVDCDHDDWTRIVAAGGTPA